MHNDRPMRASIDHLAVAAASLDGRLLDDVLGVNLSPGGRHARMGTHNRLLRLGDETYLELIAVDPQAPAPAHPRWFELDEAAMRARLAEGPRLVHWVVRADATEIPPLPFEVGPWERFERGDLSWQLTVRADGKLPADGVVPSLIRWSGSAHPAASLPESGVSLEALELEHPRAADVQRQLDLLGLDVRCSRSALPGIIAHLRTPSGPRTLRSTEPLR
jgi:Glyoxalase-like domain